jgi:hypothetical protein
VGVENRVTASDQRLRGRPIVCRLLAAGRLDAAVEWIDRADAAGRVSGHDPGGNAFCLDSRAVARACPGCGRDDDALSVPREQFRLWGSGAPTLGNTGRAPGSISRAMGSG